MGIEDTLRREAREIAQSAQYRIAGLEQEIPDLEKRLAKAKAERDTACLATQRLTNYRISLGPDYQCPRCWIEHKRASPLRPVPIDSFACDVCQGQFVIEY